MADYLLGLDAGTTGCKTCIFDLDGKLISSDYREYPCYYPQPGWVEQIPEDLTPALFASIRTALDKSGIDPRDIKGMSISSQGSITGLVDENHNLLRPFIGWQDLRGEQYLAEIAEAVGKDKYYQITGAPLGSMMSISKLYWVRKNEPELFDRAAMFTTHQDYFLKVFGAEEYWTDSASASREGMLDVDQLAWDKVTHDFVGIPLEKRAKVTNEPGKVVGGVSKYVASQTGLAEGTPLCVGSLDQNCSTFGGGDVRPGDTVMVIGTFGSCFVVLDESRRDPKGRLIVKPNYGIGNYTIEAFSNTSASSFRWYRDVMASEARIAAKFEGADPYDLITRSVENIGPGSNGVTFLPYLQGASGSRQNGMARATFLGMTLGTTQADMAHAVLEGICFEMLDILEAQADAGIEVGTIRLSGGASKSPYWCQMMADIFQRPIALLQTSETGCLGAALYAGVGTGLYSSCEEASDRAVKITSTYEPNEKMAGPYREAFEKFVKVYEALDKTIFV